MKEKTLRNVLIVSTLIIVMIVGYFVWVTMFIEIEQYEDEIVEIGPSGVTNLFPILVIVLVSALILEIILWRCKKPFKDR